MTVAATLRTCVPAVALCVLTGACGHDVTGPSSGTPLPFVRETSTMRVYYEPGDTADVEWQEAYNAWALTRLGLQVPQKVEYRKYVSPRGQAPFWVGPD